MKFQLCLFILLTLTLSGCKKEKSADISTDFLYDSLRDGDLVFRRGIGIVSQAVIAVDKGGGYSHIGIVVKEQKDMLLAFLQEKGQKGIEDKGGLKCIDIVSEVIDADRTNAKVILLQTYGNGDTENANYDMVKKDGTWKMVIKK